MIEEIRTPKSYKNAWRCKKCPQSNKEDGCPMWWEVFYEKMGVSGSEGIKVVKGCGLQLQSEYMVEVIKASNRPAKQISAMQNEMHKSLNRVALLMHGGMRDGEDRVPLPDGAGDKEIIRFGATGTADEVADDNGDQGPADPGLHLDAPEG